MTEKIKIKVIMFLGLIVSVVFMGNSCAEPVCTQVTYGVNNFQNGETIGRGQFSSSLGAQLAPSFKSEMELSEDFDSNKVNTKPYEYLDDFHESTLLVDYSLRYGITRNFDLNVNVSVGLNDGGTDEINAAAGAKIYGKYRVTDRRSNFSISLMPGVGYSSGTAAKIGDVEIESHLLGFELLFPMSYRFSEDMTLNFGPKLYYFYYNVPTEYSWPENKKIMTKKETFEETLFAPAFSLGFRYKWVSPEITFTQIDDKFMPYFGIGFILK